MKKETRWWPFFLKLKSVFSKHGPVQDVSIRDCIHFHGNSDRIYYEVVLCAFHTENKDTVEEDD